MYLFNFHKFCYNLYGDIMKKLENVLNDIFKFNLSNKVMSYLSFFSLALLLILLPVAYLLYEIFKVSYLDLLFNITYVIFFVISMYILIYDVKTKGFKKLDIVFILYLLVILISSIFSYVPFKSLLGSSLRHDGFITYLLYFLVYETAKNLDNDKIKKLFNIVMVIGVINFIYAIIQSYLNYNILSAKSFGHMAYGLIGHPNFFATYTLMLAIMSLCLYLKRQSIKYIIYSMIMYAGLVLASSTGPFLTFIGMLIMLFIYLLIKKRSLLKKFLMLVPIYVILYFVFSLSTVYINSKTYNGNVKEINTISGDILSLSNGDGLYKKLNRATNGRLALWNDSFKYIDRNNSLLLGCGPDNFNLYRITINENDITGFINYDKLHNIYLNTLVETGIFSLIIYILWMIIYHKKIISKKNMLSYILLFSVIGYNIQGIFNINVYNVMVYYYIFIGIAIGLGDENETRKH